MEIMPGAEAFSYSGSKNTGILLIHGISGSPFEVSYWGKKLSEAEYHVEAPRLKGHGTYWKDLSHAKFTDWIADIENALSELKKRVSTVFAGGLSMGGALTLYLAEKHPELKGIIVVNHAMLIDNPLLFLLPVLKYMVPYTKKTKGNVSRSIKDKSVNMVNYNRMPTWGVAELLKLLKTVRANLHEIKQPVLIFKSRNDSKALGGEKSVEFTCQNIGSKDREVVRLENSYHIATMDFDKDIIVEKSLEFIKRLV